MNYIDLIILVVVIVGAVYGSIKGIINQLGALGGLIIGIIVSRIFGGLFSSLFQSAFDMPAQVSDIVSYTVVFVAVYIACLQLVKLIHQLANLASMGWIDRIAGVLFGAVQYLFGLSLLLNLAAIIDTKGDVLPQKDLAASKYYERALHFAPTAFAMAREKWDAENKESAHLFIPYTEDNNTPLYCENCKVD